DIRAGALQAHVIETQAAARERPAHRERIIEFVSLRRAGNVGDLKTQLAEEAFADGLGRGVEIALKSRLPRSRADRPVGGAVLLGEKLLDGEIGKTNVGSEIEFDGIDAGGAAD